MENIIIGISAFSTVMMAIILFLSYRYVAKKVVDTSDRVGIFLDDERLPYDSTGWTIAKNSDTFRDVFKLFAHRVTDISFDHDLGPESQDGMSCLRFVIDSILDNPTLGRSLKRITVHTANTIGSENLMALANSAKNNIPEMRDITIIWKPVTIFKDYAYIPMEIKHD